MRKVLFLLAFISFSICVQAQFNPNLHTISNKPFAANGRTADARTYFYDAGTFSYRPYASRSEILTYLNSTASRTGHFPIIMDSVGVRYELWFRNGTTDAHLEIKASGVGTAAEVKYENVDNVAAMIALPGKAGRIIRTDGRLSPGDGGGAEYRWEAASTDAVDNIYCFLPTGHSGPGRLKLVVHGNQVPVKALGIKGDNSAEGAAIVNGLNKAAANGHVVLMDNATLNMNGDSGVFSNKVYLYANNREKAIIRNGKFIAPRGGMQAMNVSIKDFTAGAIYTDTLHGGVKRPLNNRWQLEFYYCYFENNQYDFREGTGAGKRDSTAATGPYLVNSKFIGNTFKKSKYASFQLDMLYENVTITGNTWDSTGSPLTYNYTLNIGMDGRANHWKETGLVIANNNFNNIIHTQDESGTFYAILARGNGLVFNGNILNNVGGPAYFGGDNLKINGNSFYNNKNYVKYGITVKDVSPEGSISINDNSVVGYYGSGVYVETEAQTISINKNYIRLDPKGANIGIAGIRVIGDGNVKTLSIHKNDIYNNQTNSGTNAVFLSSTGTIENIAITENTIDSKSVGVSAKMVDNCNNLIFSRNPYVRSVGSSTIGAKNLSMDDNTYYHLSTWMNLYIKDQALISHNKVNPDSSLVGSSPATLSRMFNIETDAATNNAVYTLLNNQVDMRKLTNMVRIEDSIASIAVIGDRVINGVAAQSSAYIGSVTNAPMTMNVSFDNFKNPFNCYAFSSSTDNQELRLTFRNSTIGRDALLSLTGVTQVYKSLTIDNCEFPINPNVSQVFETYDFIGKAGLNKRAVGAGAYTLVQNDIIKGKSNVIEAALSSPITITIPPKTTASLPLGAVLKIHQAGTGGDAKTNRWRYLISDYAIASNQIPVTEAGDDIVTSATSVTLKGYANDPDGTIAMFQWTQVSGLAATIATPGNDTTVVSGLSTGTYEFQLKSYDNTGSFSTDVVAVTVQSNNPPVANAGPDQSITLPTNSVTLNGSSSIDTDGSITNYLWQNVSGVGEQIVSPYTANTQVNNLSEGIYKFKLTVTDNLGATSISTMEVTVLPNISASPEFTTVKGRKPNN